MLVMTPGPVSSEMWRAVTGNRRDVHLASLRAAGERASPADSLAQRAGKPSVGGDMAAFSPSSGFQRELPPMWSPLPMRKFGVCPSGVGRVSDGEDGQIL